MIPQEIEALQRRVQEDSAFLKDFKLATEQVIIGQSAMMEKLMVGLLAKGHILLEGLPGLAKTLAIKTLSQLVDGAFSRIQFTPDLLPADVVGTMIYNPGTTAFTVRKGPLFANFVLADEINRAPAKVQSALLEGMQERQVTIGGTTYPLVAPFLVLATQNPIEQEGTYALPEAQTDRFMLKVQIGYPNKEEEKAIIRLNMGQTLQEKVQPIVQLSQILKAQATVQAIYMDEKIEQYIVDIVFATREPASVGLATLPSYIKYGASPRGSINLALAAKAVAFIKGRGYVTPEDVRYICKDVLSHRIGLTYEAEAENITQTDIIHKIMEVVEIP